MRFKIARTSRPGTYETQKPEYREFDTIEELLAFKEEMGQELIITDDWKWVRNTDGTGQNVRTEHVIEIYDYYRE